MSNTDDSERGAGIGAVGLPALLLAFPTGIELSVYGLHHADESCGMVIFAIILATLGLAVIGALIGAIAGAYAKSIPVSTRSVLQRIGIASLLLMAIGFTCETAFYKAPAFPVRCYI